MIKWAHRPSTLLDVQYLIGLGDLAYKKGSPFAFPPVYALTALSRCIEPQLYTLIPIVHHRILMQNHRIVPANVPT